MSTSMCEVDPQAAPQSDLCWSPTSSGAEEQQNAAL